MFSTESTNLLNWNAFHQELISLIAIKHLRSHKVALQKSCFDERNPRPISYYRAQYGAKGHQCTPAKQHEIFNSELISQFVVRLSNFSCTLNNRSFTRVKKTLYQNELSSNSRIKTVLTIIFITKQMNFFTLLKFSIDDLKLSCELFPSPPLQ